MGILAVTAAWSVAGMETSGQANGAISTTSGFMDECRQYALANNTYVYVSLYQNPALSGASSEVWLGAMASTDGTDISSAGKDNVVAGSGAQAISKVLVLKGVTLQSATQAAIASAVNWSAPAGVVDVSQGGTAQMGPLGASETMLPVSFYFAPDGSVSTNGTLSTALTFGLEMGRGSTASHPVNPAVFQITGLAGVTKVFRE
jgi:hypothetical protein